MKVKTRLLWLTTVFSLAILQGCGGSDDKESSSSTPPVSVQPQKPNLSINGSTGFSLTTSSLFKLEFMNRGDDVTSCSISPQIPTGLSLDKFGGTCVLLGIPFQEFSQTSFTITGSNGQGYSIVEVNLTSVDDSSVPPIVAETPVLKLVNGQVSYQIEANEAFVIDIANNGAPADSCVSSPSLPLGFVLKRLANTCLITGITETAQVTTAYEITASNDKGSSSVSLNIEVVANDTLITTPDMSITDSQLESITAVGQFFSLEIRNEGGNVNSCSITPELPNGLSIEQFGNTCVIVGLPKVTSELASYRVEGSNITGADSVDISIRVNQAAPKVVIPNKQIFELSTGKLFSLVLTSSEGTINECESAIALPIGLIIKAEGGRCEISGQAQSPSELTDYRVEVRNESGSDAVTLSISVTQVAGYEGDGPNPVLFDFVASVGELDNPQEGIIFARSEYSQPQNALTIQTSGFPNVITELSDSDGNHYSSKAEIAQMFELVIDPLSGDVRIQLMQQLDFESKAAFYELELSLGNEVKTVLVRLYDLQNGNEAEPLTISNYDELRSFADGQFVSSNIGFDDIQLGDLASSNTQNISHMTVMLDRDIDASVSANNPWQPFNLYGALDGNSHVISNITVAEANLSSESGFIVHDSRFYENKAVVKRIGFDNARFGSRFIYLNNGQLDRVYLSGVSKPLKKSHSNTVFPITSTLNNISKVYTNIYFDLGTIDEGSRVELSGIFGAMASFFYIDSAYSNGMINVDLGRTVPNAHIAGIAGNAFGYSSDGEELLLSAVGFNVTGTPNVTTDYVGFGVGGLLGRGEFAEGPFDSSDYQFRFVTDRNSDGITRSVANLFQDLNNDGINDDPENPNRGPNADAAGMTFAELTKASNFTGKWIESDSHFDITDGEYPVLKGMPYPHTPGAAWMGAQDPGALHQRLTFNDFVSDPDD